MHVEVPTTLTTSPSCAPAPIASQCASNAPTGIGMPARRPSFSAHCGARAARDLVGRCVLAFQLRANACKQRIDLCQKTLRRQAAERGIPHPLVAHGADAAFHAAGIGDAAQRGRDHVAVLEGADELRALVWIVAQPVQQLGESPFGGVDAAAPLDGLEFVECARVP